VINKNNIWILIAMTFIVIYGLWLAWFRKDATPTDGFTKSIPAVSAPKVDGPIIKPPIKIVPKDPVKKKFPTAQIQDDEEWVDTADIPPAPNGATVLTKIDTVSGEVTNQIQNKKAPWFAFEDNNYVGVGLDTSKKVDVYYKRDLVRVKDLHLQVGGQLKGNQTEIELIGRAGLEYRF
jgi:hypothetical protein